MMFSSTDTLSKMMLFCGYTESSTMSSPYVAIDQGFLTAGFASASADQTLTRAEASDGTVKKITVNFSSSASSKICFGAWTDSTWSRTINWYSFKIWNDNILLGHYVPCYRVSDNIVGMYDLVTESFYTNVGTGAFVSP